MKGKKKSTVTLPRLLKKTQEVFNRYVRSRDKELGCICCGGSVDHAGHYFSQGQYSALRFDEWNVNGCCIKCNTYLHGNLIMYRKGLVRKIGEGAVNELEEQAIANRVKKWTREELNDIIKKYS